MPNTAITVAPIPQHFLARARRERVDALGQPVREVTAEGGEPCRDALRRALPGEKLLLASFTPFTKPGPFHEYGPVYILDNDAADSVRVDGLPPIGNDSDYLRDQFVIRAYSAAEDIIDAAMTKAADASETIDRLFASPATAFLHVRFPTYGCFALRIDRA